MMADIHSDTVTDRRIIEETGTDRRLSDLVAPMLAALDFRLVRVRLSSRDDTTLQIMAERNDGTMTVEDCEQASRALSPLLDVEDPIGKPYRLEVSSPGIDRPLVWLSDFERWQGHEVRIETGELVDARRRFRGLLAGVTDNGIILRRQKTGYGQMAEIEIAFDLLADCRLVITDELIRSALRADKKARNAARKHGLNQNRAD